MMRFTHYCYWFAFTSLSAWGAERHTAHSKGNLNPWTGEGVSLGGVLFPELHYQAAADSSTTNPGDLAVGHHDPDRHGITQQDIEFALAAQLGEHVRLFGRYSAKIDQDDRWQDEFEEYYAEFSGMPWGLTLKGGRFYTQFGYHNTAHPHEFTFVDQYLASGRLIGEDSAVIYGGQLSLPVLASVLPVGWSDQLTVSYGVVPDFDEEEHAHGGEEAEAPFEGGEAIWNDGLATVNYSIAYAPRRAMRYEGGLSAAWGKNHFGRQTQLYGLHFETLWKPSEDTAEFLRWRTEGFLRRFGAASSGEAHAHEDEAAQDEHEHEEEGEHEEHDSHAEEEGHAASPRRDEFTDVGFYSALSYGLPSGNLQAHLRAEYVSGVADAGLRERYRVSPALTWKPGKDLPIYFKLQYNYDHIPSLGNEHSVWLQFNFTWGDSCSHAHVH